MLEVMEDRWFGMLDDDAPKVSRFFRLRDRILGVLLRGFFFCVDDVVDGAQQCMQQCFASDKR